MNIGKKDREDLLSLLVRLEQYAVERYAQRVILFKTESDGDPEKIVQMKRDISETLAWIKELVELRRK